MESQPTILDVEYLCKVTPGCLEETVKSSSALSSRWNLTECLGAGGARALGGKEARIADHQGGLCCEAGAENRLVARGKEVAV